jgi:hypothetical protein
MYKCILAIALLSVSCKTEHSFDKHAAEDGIQSLMLQQETDWNNADIDGFMSIYWQSDSLKFIGKRGITYGWQNTLNNYKKGYPTAEAMGRLDFDNLSFEFPDSTNALVVGKWTLFRSADTLGGYYTLHWKKLLGRWVIVSDHTS